MSHEIETTDTVATYKQQAWHGLARVFDEDMTPTEGVRKFIDWENLQYPLYALKGVLDNGEPDFELVGTHVANFRSDNDKLLGVVSAGYQPIQNIQMAEFCEALVEQDRTVTCESIGTIRGGKRVWILIHGEPFDVTGHDDTVYPYLCISNGHDGGASFRVTPTTIRVVCSNTLHMVIPRHDGMLDTAAISLNHTTNIMQRVEQAKDALQHYAETMKRMREDVLKPMTRKQVKEEDLRKFFYEAYQEDFGEIPTNPQKKVEHNRVGRAKSAFACFHKRFDDELEIAGATVWGMLNSYSGLVQHDKKAYGKDDAARIEKRIDSNLFGLNQKRTQNALQRAYRLAAV